ncbi:MAG: hypothetical protein ACTSRW_05850 [Candidatus Helarchaeota archaeon]
MEELPDKVFVPLGRRGFDPIPLKYCHVCKNRSACIKIVGKESSEKQEGNSILEEIDYKATCDSCGETFYFRVRKIYDVIDGEKRLITATINILDDKKNDLGWLGNF